MPFPRIAFLTVPAIVLLGSASGVLSNSGYENAWFRALDLPGFMPPGWAFPFTWTALYAFLGIVLALLIDARGAARRGAAIGLFLAQLAVNYSWPPVFFALREVEAGLGLIAVMIVLTLILLPLAAGISRTAAVLMLPYLGWLCFAFALNYQVMVLNPGASTLAPAPSSTDIPPEQV